MPLQTALAQAIFVAIFLLIAGPKILLWFVGLIAFTAIYNFPRYGLKQNPPFDIINQAEYLLVFVSHVSAKPCSAALAL